MAVFLAIHAGDAADVAVDLAQFPFALMPDGQTNAVRRDQGIDLVVVHQGQLVPLRVLVLAGGGRGARVLRLTAHGLVKPLGEQGLLLAEDELRRQQGIAPLGLSSGQGGEAQTFGAALCGLFHRGAHALQGRVEVGIETVHECIWHALW